MKLLILLAVVGVCGAADYSCNTGADGAKEKKDCPSAGAMKCKFPNYIDSRNDTYKGGYECGGCTAEDNKLVGCMECTNSVAATACNVVKDDVHAYKCPKMKKDNNAWVADTVKADCTSTPAADYKTDKATEICFKATAEYLKDANGAAEIKTGGCGTCAELAKIKGETDDTKKKALMDGCEDNSGAAAMSFILAPLLAVLFWLH